MAGEGKREITFLEIPWFGYHTRMGIRLYSARSVIHGFCRTLPMSRLGITWICAIFWLAKYLYKMKWKDGQFQVILMFRLVSIPENVMNLE